MSTKLELLLREMTECERAFYEACEVSLKASESAGKIMLDEGIKLEGECPEYDAKIDKLRKEREEARFGARSARERFEEIKAKIISEISSRQLCSSEAVD